MFEKTMAATTIAVVASAGSASAQKQRMKVHERTWRARFRGMDAPRIHILEVRGITPRATA